MCGRYTNTAGVEELNARFTVPIANDAGTHRFNIAPTEEVLAIVAPKGQPEAQLLRWGLIPPWAKDLKGGAKMINARMETVATTPAYRGLIPKGSRRALQIADGYFEWLKPEQRAGSKAGPRQPFFFQVDGGIPFAFAALWTPAKVAGEWIHSVTLLTCDSAPNRVAAAIHDRMPVYPGRPRRPAGLAGSRPGCRGSARSMRRAAGRAHVRPPGQPRRQQGRKPRRRGT